MRYIYSIIIFFLFTSGSYSQTPGYIDTLKHQLQIREEADTAADTQIKILMRLAYYSSAPDQKHNYLVQVIEKSKLTNKKNYEAWAYNSLSDYHRQLGNNIESIKYGILAANMYGFLKDNMSEAQCLHSIGKTFYRIEDFKNSLSYLNQSVQIQKSQNDTLRYSSAYLSIGECYRLMGARDSALFYYNLSKSTMESIVHLNESDQKLFKENYATIQGNLGMVLNNQKDYHNAKEHLEYAIQFFTTHLEPYRLSVYQFELGKVLVSLGEKGSGEKMIHESFALAVSSKLKEQIRDFSKDLSTFYEQQGDLQKALQHYKIYKAYFDSIQNIETVRNMEQQQSEFMLSKKQEEIESLSSINRLQRKLSIVLFVAILVVIIFIFNLYTSNKKVKKSNIEITKQKELVEQRENEKALLLRELNHRVKNNLQMVASLLNLHSRQLKGHPAAEALQAGRYRVEALTLIHQKLYRDDIDTKIDIQDYIDELAKNLILNFAQNFTLKLDLIPLIMKIDKAIPLGLILNELLTNSLKYGQKDNVSPELKIGIIKKMDDVILTIADNGEGLPSDFNFKKTNSFGLKLVHSLTKQLGGKIEWSNKSGTTWTITLNTIKIC